MLKPYSIWFSAFEIAMRQTYLKVCQYALKKKNFFAYTLQITPDLDQTITAEFNCLTLKF